MSVFKVPYKNILIEIEFVIRESPQIFNPWT